MNRLVYKDFRLRRSIDRLDTFRLPKLFFLTNCILYRRSSVFHTSLASFRYASILFSRGRYRHFHFTRFRNRCFVTGNSHSVYSQFRMSRMPLRESILEGRLHGIRKSSW